MAGSSALAADLQTLEALSDRRELLRDLSFDVTDIHVVSESDGRAVVTAQVVTGPHVVVGQADGEVRQKVGRSAPRTVRLKLQRTGGRWQVDSVG